MHTLQTPRESVPQLEQPHIQSEPHREPEDQPHQWPQEIVGVVETPTVTPFVQGMKRVYYATEGADGQLSRHQAFLAPGETLVLRGKGEDERRIWAVGEALTQSLFGEPCAGEEYSYGRNGWRRPYQDVRVIDQDRANVEAYAVKAEGDDLAEASARLAEADTALKVIEYAETVLKGAALVVGQVVEQARQDGIEAGHSLENEGKDFQGVGHLGRLRYNSDVITTRMVRRRARDTALLAFDDAVQAHRQEAGSILRPAVAEVPEAEAEALVKTDVDSVVAASAPALGHEITETDTTDVGGVDMDEIARELVDALALKEDQPKA